MAPGQELQVQEKREIQRKEEQTLPARTFLPTTDIYETDEALTLVMEMPGVGKNSIDVSLENDVLTVSGKIDLTKYEKLQPVYTEYNIGPYRRSFNLTSSRINQDRISAEIRDGVLTLTLPKADQAKPRKISVA